MNCTLRSGIATFSVSPLNAVFSHQQITDCHVDQVQLRLGHGSASHRLGGVQQERLDVFVAEKVAPAGWRGLVVIVRRIT
jgi:fructose-1,6-bisphosphatase/inositol monophosphatase family enzyme